MDHRRQRAELPVRQAGSRTVDGNARSIEPGRLPPGVRRPVQDMPERFTVVALIYVNPEGRRDYEHFEREASRIMARHGGRIERRVGTLQEPEATGDMPDEVHLVTFPSRQSLEAYRTDPALKELATLRARAIRRTVLWHGTDLAGFD